MKPRVVAAQPIQDDARRRDVGLPDVERVDGLSRGARRGGQRREAPDRARGHDARAVGQSGARGHGRLLGSSADSVAIGGGRRVLDSRVALGGGRLVPPGPDREPREIAARVLRACRELGLETVAVHSEADAERPVARRGDDGRCASARRRRALVPRRRRHPAGRRADRRPGRSTPGTASSPRTPSSRRAAPSTGSRSSVPGPRAIRRMGTRSAPSARWPRRACRSIPGSLDPLASAAHAAELAATSRLSGPAEGDGRRRRKGMRRCDDAKDAGAGVRRGLARGGQGVRERRALPREVPGGRPPHRDSRSWPTRYGARRPPGRAGMLDSAAATRSSSRSRPSPALDAGERATSSAQRAAARAASFGYVNAGTLEFLRAADGSAVLHGDEHAPAGRAPGHGDGDRHRPRDGAAGDRGGRAARAAQSDVRRRAARDRVPHQRRGSRSRVPPRPGIGHGRRARRLSTRPARRCAGTRASPRAGAIPSHYDSLIGKLIVHARDARRGDRGREGGARVLAHRGHRRRRSRCTCACSTTRRSRAATTTSSTSPGSGLVARGRARGLRRRWRRSLLEPIGSPKERALDAASFARAARARRRA